MTEVTHEALEALALDAQIAPLEKFQDAVTMLCTIADKLRTGQLIHAVPSGEDAMVERVRQAIWDALRKGMPQQKVPKGRTDITALATAAITALDAVRKARENGDG